MGAPKFSAGKRALGLCDVCGFSYKLKTLKRVFRKGEDSGLLACKTCWDGDHPQNFQGMYPVYDPQALRNPRPDSGEFAQSRQVAPAIHGVVASGKVGQVTIVVN